MAIRVLIADDMKKSAEFFSSVLENEPDFEVVGVAVPKDIAPDLAMELEPDAVLVDVQPKDDFAGIDVGEEIIDTLPDVKVIALASHADNSAVVRAFRIGFSDYLLKTESVAQIIGAIRDAVVPPRRVNVKNMLVEEMNDLYRKQAESAECMRMLSALSKTEIEVISLLCRGKKYSEIAEIRNVEDVTIRSIVYKISQKLNGKKMKELVPMFRKSGILELLYPELS